MPRSEEPNKPPVVLQYGKPNVAQKRVGEISAMLGVVAGLLALIMWIYAIPVLILVICRYRPDRDNGLDELIPWLAIASVLTFVAIRWCRDGFRGQR